MEIIAEGEKRELKKISMKLLLKNNGEKGRPLWVMIHNKIYDVSKFKHPGGKSLLINDDDEHYEDKGIEFDSVGHSKEAIQQLESMLIGEISEGKGDKDDALENNEDLGKIEEEKKDSIVELQPMYRIYRNKDDELIGNNDHFRAITLTCIIVVIIILLIITF